MKEIVQKDNPLLRETAREVPLADIESKEIQDIIADMSTALAQQEDGVAIAAPQIAVPLRIFVVAQKIFTLPEEGDQTEALEQEQAPQPKEKLPDVVFINPVITKQSKTKKWMDEGCLSVRWLYGEVNRSTKTTVKAFDKTGKAFTRGGSGLLSQIFQHEIDHLGGVLFIDKARDVEEVLPEKRHRHEGHNI